MRASPLSGRYLIKNPLSHALISLVDGALPRVSSKELLEEIPPPKRVLIANTAHIGDAIIATAILPEIRKRFPEAEIGMLIASWSVALFAGHPLVRWVHTIDHWRLNRGSAGKRQKLFDYARSRRRAVKEIARNGYDLALDLSPFFPNSIVALWEAGVPVRVGFTSAGFGALLTHPLDWLDSDLHVAHQQLRLLDAVSKRGEERAELRPVLPAPDEVRQRKLAERLAEKGIKLGEYVVVHPGTGSAIKEWPVERWSELVEALSDGTEKLVLSGSGAVEIARAEVLSDRFTSAMNLTGQLDWKSFVALVASAKAIICTDSAAAHVAAAFGTPCLVITPGINHPNHWRPLSPQAVTLTNPVTCSPCYLSKGCEGMDCVRGVLPKDAEAAVRIMLQRGREAGEHGSRSVAVTAGKHLDSNTPGLS